MRERGGYGVHIRHAVDSVEFSLRAYFPRGYDGRGAVFSAPLRSLYDRFSAGPLAIGGPAGPFHDTLPSSGWVPHPVPGRDGGGRDNENRLFED